MSASPGRSSPGLRSHHGPGVSEAEAKPGQRVMIHHYWGCGQCKHCRVGWSQLCKKGIVVYGMTGHGGHAPFMQVPAFTLVPLPDELSFEEGAAISCGTGTAYGALKRIDASGRDTLAVFGQGPVGLSATMLGHAMGARVIAVDTGHGQIAFQFRNHPRVRLLEKTNARYLTREQVGEAVDLMVMDVSFISAALVLPAVITSAFPESPAERRGRQAVVLVKPQFEVGRRQVGKGGIVRDVGCMGAEVIGVLDALERLRAELTRAGSFGYRAWLQALLNTPDEMTGKSLVDDPSPAVRAETEAGLARKHGAAAEPRQRDEPAGHSCIQHAPIPAK